MTTGLQFSLNHVTVPHLNLDELLGLSGRLNCVGIELRNDLQIPFLDGNSPETAAKKTLAHKLQLLAVSEIKSFDDFSDQKLAEASQLIEIARRCGSHAVSLIPRNDGRIKEKQEAMDQLKLALKEIKPLLISAGLKGFVEPLGFETCSLRLKADAMRAIDAIDGFDTYGLIHDTFHHYLAGEAEYFPGQTAMVHISGVIQENIDAVEMRDQHRVLVNEHDRIETIPQLRSLAAGGYAGPVSLESFAPEIQTMKNPQELLANSIKFIKNGL